MKYTIRVLVLLWLSSLPAYPVWQRNIINYERSVYQAGFQNWMVAQDNNKWMYFANSKGLLEFDGVYWSLYPVKNRIVRSVKIINGLIYAGASSEFGYFDKDETGKLSYRSLSDKLPAWGGEIWNITEIAGKIYFLADNIIFVYDAKTHEIAPIPTENKIDYCSTSVNERLYIATTEGLFYLNRQNELVLDERSQPIVGEKIVGLCSYNGDILVTTARAGIYLIGNEGCKRIHSAADAFILRNQLFCSIVSGNRMALGSVLNGVFIFEIGSEASGETYNIANGLTNNTVLSMRFDRDNNLWLGLDKGISYIDLNSPIRPLFPINSQIGTGYCSVVYNNKLYLGTNQGLYRIDDNGDCRMVENAEGQIWSLAIIDGCLFCSGDNGIVVISGSTTYRIKTTGVWEVRPIASDKGILIAGTYSGFRLIYKEGGTWGKVRPIRNFSNSCRGFIEDDKPNTFWMANANGSIERVTINPQTAEIANRKSYRPQNSNIGDNTFIRRMYGNIIVCTEDGIFQYSRISDEFIPYPPVFRTNNCNTLLSI
jgi:ligand-binding sensor domain-containing protein